MARNSDEINRKHDELHDKLKELIINNKEGAHDEEIKNIVNAENFKVTEEIKDLANLHLKTVKNCATKGLICQKYYSQNNINPPDNAAGLLIGSIDCPFEGYVIKDILIPIDGGKEGFQHYTEGGKGRFYTKDQWENKLKMENKKIDGAQEKKPGSGWYTKNGVRHYIKSSATNPADDIAEVVTAKLMVDLVQDPKNPETYKNAVVSYFPVWNKDLKTPFVSSAVTEGYDCSLKDRAKEIGANFPLDKSEPHPLDDSKKIIHGIFFSPQMKKDMARILAANLLKGDYDCQPGNHFIYKKDGVERIGSYDHGWGMADLLHEKHLKIKLFDIKVAKKFGWFGARKGRGTHTEGGLPTNHFRDYPYLVKSQDFIDALRDVAANAKQKRLNTHSALYDIEQSYSQIENPSEREEMQKVAFKNFALHLAANSETFLDKLGFPKNGTSNEMKIFLVGKLIEVDETRGNSMLLTASLLEMRLKRKELKDDTAFSADSLSKNPAKMTETKEKIEACFRKTLTVIKESFFSKKDPQQVDAFMPNEGQDESLTNQIKKMLDFAKDRGIQINPNLQKLCEKLIIKGSITYQDGSRTINGGESITSAELNEVLLLLQPSSPTLHSSALAELSQKLSNGAVNTVSSGSLLTYSNTNTQTKTQPLQSQSTKSQEKSLSDLADQIINAINTVTKSTNTDGSVVVLALEQTKVSLSSSQDNSLIIKELPGNNAKNAEKNCATLFAQSLIASGDPNPEITNGSPKKVLELLRALEENNSPINPKIDPMIIKNIEMPPNYGGLNENERAEFKRIQEMLTKRQLEKQPPNPEDTISLHATTSKKFGV